MLGVILKRAGLGFLLGNFIGYFIALLTTGSFIPVASELVANSGSLANAVLIQISASGGYGAICFAGITFYEIDRWPLALSSIVHCAIIIICFIPLSFLLHWTGSITESLIMSGIQLVVYFIIWLIICAVYKKQVKELNEMQNDYSAR